MADFLWICIRDGFNLELAIRIHNEKQQLSQAALV